MNTLGHAILGLIAARPRTGYDVARAMKAPIGYMWTANHSQIYPELARLESQGLVASTVIDGRGPRDTKRYSITDAGRDELRAWVMSPLRETARSEFMLRVRCLWLLSPEDARAFVSEQRQRYVDRLAVYDDELAFAPEADAPGNPTTVAFTEFATLRYSVARMRFIIEWCDWLLAELDAARSREPAASSDPHVPGRPGDRGSP